MSHKDHDTLNEFRQLTEQLSATENQPSTTNMPPTAKLALREELLSQYDTPRLSRQGIGNLWRFAGSAAGAFLLLFVVVNFWLAIAQNGNTVGSSSTPSDDINSVITPTLTISKGLSATPITVDDDALTPPPPPLFDEAEWQEAESGKFILVSNFPVEFGDALQLINAEMTSENISAGNPIQFNLYWEATGRPSANYTAFVHLLDNNGKLVAQADVSLGESATFVKGVRPVTPLTLLLPEAQEDESLQIVMGLYDTTTGQQLPVSTNGSGFLLGQITLGMETAVSPTAIINGNSNQTLLLHSTPDGEPKGILAENTAVYLTSQLRHEINGQMWQAIKTADRQYGWVRTDILTFYPADYSPPEIVNGGLVDSVSVDAVKQSNRSNTDSPIPIEIKLNLQLKTVEEAVLKVGYAHPNWETENSARLLIDGLGKNYAVTSDMETITINDVLNPVELQHVIQTVEPVIVVQLGTLTFDQSGREQFDVLYMETFETLKLWLDNTAEIEQTFPPIMHFTSARQTGGETAVVTFEVTAELMPLENYTMQLLLVNPNTPLDLSQIDSVQWLEPSQTENSYFITATPEQIREATSTDTPVVLSIVELTNHPTATKILTFFSECPMDLTRNDSFSCEP